HKSEAIAPEEAALKPVFATMVRAGKILPVAAALEYEGLHLEPVMGHTKGSLAVRVTAKGREVIFTGDECYFSRSCKAKIPLPAGAVYSAAANRQFIESLNPQSLLLTGHETELTDGRWLNDYVFFFF